MGAGSCAARRWAIGLALLGLAASPGWSAGEAGRHFMRAAFESGASLSLETVDTPAGRSRGLMYRRRIPEDWGMLFVFEKPDYLSFWMRNTAAPLSIAFVTEDGRISNIRTMRPYDQTTRHRSTRPARYAIEVRQGWFADHGVRAGQRVQLLAGTLLPGEARPRMPGADDLVEGAEPGEGAP